MARDLIRVRWRSMRGLYAIESAPRRVIIHADDYGLAPGINRAVEDGLQSGALHSASILLGGQDAQGRPRLGRLRIPSSTSASTSISLTDVRFSPPRRVPSLVGGDGRFRPLAPFFTRFILGRVALPEIAAEWRAQIAAARGAGVRISHLDSHQHVHLIPSVFRGVAARLATEERVSSARDGRPDRRGSDARRTSRGSRWRSRPASSVGRRFRHLIAARGAGVLFGITRRSAHCVRRCKARVRERRSSSSFTPDSRMRRSRRPAIGYQDRP